MREGRWSIAFGRESLRAILSAPPPRPTAVICGNDYLAIGALLEARAMGLEVPRELSFTGFDDVAMAAQIDKPELAQERDKTQHRERQAAIPKIEQTRSIEEELGLLRKKRAGPEGFQRP
jgi:LacI family transcriptional regulator